MKVTLDLEQLPDQAIIHYGKAFIGPKSYDWQGGENARPTKELHSITVAKLKEVATAEGLDNIEIKAISFS